MTKPREKVVTVGNRSDESNGTEVDLPGKLWIIGMSNEEMLKSSGRHSGIIESNLKSVSECLIEETSFYNNILCINRT